jgi:hypothetical protein
VVVDYVAGLPWRDGEYTHIAMNDVLTSLDREQAINLVKEMYRISDNGAIWEIRAPHWLSDVAHSPVNKMILSPQFFQQLDQRFLMDDQLRKGDSSALLTYQHNVDVSLIDMRYEYTPLWQSKIDNNETTTEELQFALNHLNNVATHVIFLLQVHKPQRYNISEFEEAIAQICNR